MSAALQEVPRFWLGDVETVCNVCDRPISRVFIDGRTRGGQWAIMCQGCAATVGTGIGLGRGQRYEQQENGRWLKTG